MRVEELAIAVVGAEVGPFHGVRGVVDDAAAGNAVDMTLRGAGEGNCKEGEKERHELHGELVNAELFISLWVEGFEMKYEKYNRASEICYDTRRQKAEYH